ncbi:MAG: hypothetical protein EXR77_07575 [Myxococcales bacterium]|nr:hypothetical protein [Myxococcales bacterium]
MCSVRIVRAQKRIVAAVAVGVVICGARCGTTAATADAGPDAADSAMQVAVDAASADGPPSDGNRSAATCLRVATAIATGKVGAPDLAELSGLAASVAQANLLWTHNDSDKPPRVFAIDGQAQLRAVVLLPTATVVDWEDIGIGPAADSTATQLFVADIGDNLANRKTITVYRFAEPKVAGQGAVAVHTVNQVAVVALAYPDGAHDAEALLVDAITGDLYLATKAANGKTKVYRAAAPHSLTAVNALEKIAQLQFGSAPLLGVGAGAGDKEVTGGAVRTDGGAVVLRTKSTAFWWARAPQSGIAEAFLAPTCAIALPAEIQGEGIAFAADGSLWTISEGASAQLWRLPLQ